MLMWTTTKVRFEEVRNPTTLVLGRWMEADRGSSSFRLPEPHHVKRSVNDRHCGGSQTIWAPVCLQKLREPKGTRPAQR